MSKTEELSKLSMHVTMPDGSVWSVPVMVIAKDRAKNYAEEFDNDEARSLEEDTAPLFLSSHYEIEDWAANNMDWSDVAEHAQRIELPVVDPDYQEGWVNGEKEIVLAEPA